MAVSSSGELAITLSELRTESDCDRLRGLRPDHLLIIGRRSDCPCWEYLREHVLGPMLEPFTLVTMPDDTWEYLPGRWSRGT